MIQRYVHRWHLRREQRRLELLEAYAALFVVRERRAVMRLQRCWRCRPLRRPGRELDLLTKFQAATRGWQAREQARKLREATELRNANAARVIQRHASRNIAAQTMRRECSGIVEKRGRRYSLGKFEVVVWQERHVAIDGKALVYNHLKAGAPVAPRRELPFESMRSVRAAEGAVLCIECAARSYYFQLGSRHDCEQWVANLVQLTAAAGYQVAGYVTSPMENGEPSSGDYSSGAEDGS